MPSFIEQLRFIEEEPSLIFLTENKDGTVSSYYLPEWGALVREAIRKIYALALRQNVDMTKFPEKTEDTEAINQHLCAYAFKTWLGEGKTDPLLHLVEIMGIIWNGREVYQSIFLPSRTAGKTKGGMDITKETIAIAEQLRATEGEKNTDEYLCIKLREFRQQIDAMNNGQDKEY